MKGSSYADMAPYIKEVTGHDCSKLTNEQMDEIGMAAERALWIWEWHNITDLSDDSRISNRNRALAEVKSVFEHKDTAPNEDDLVIAYVGGMWDQLGLG